MYEMMQSESEHRLDFIGPRLDVLYESIQRLHGHLEGIFKGYEEYKDLKPKDWFNRTFLETIAWLDSCSAELGRAIQDTANTVTYRRFRSATAISQFQVQSDKKRMRLSEIHLDYPDTYEAVESLVEDYFSRIKMNYFSESQVEYDKLSSPILVLARGQKFSFEAFAVRGKVPIVVFKPGGGGTKSGATDAERKFNSEIKADDISELLQLVQLKNLTTHLEFKTYIRYMIQLSRVVAPRSFPIMIRYSPLLAHELSHAILRVAILIISHHDNWNGKGDKYVSDSLDKVKEKYGLAMRDLIHYYRLVTTSLASFQLKYYQDLYRTKEIENKESVLNNIVGKVSPKHSKEIVADICGLILGGQSYLYALLHQIMSEYKGFPRKNGDQIIDENCINKTHPPTIVRLKILMEISTKLGFHKCVTRVNTQIGKFMNGTRFIEKADEIWDIWQTRWWNHRSVQTLSNLLIKNLIKNLSLSPLYFNCAEPDLNSPYSLKINEDKLEKFYDILANEVLNDKILIWDSNKDLMTKLESCNIENKIEGFELRPSDVINVLFYTLMEPKYKDVGRHRVAWRIALKKVSGG